MRTCGRPQQGRRAAAVTRRRDGRRLPAHAFVLSESPEDVFDVTLAIYALIRLERGDRRDALRLRAELHSWLEVRGVEARANVVGTIHERYEAGAVRELDGPRARLHDRRERRVALRP